MQNISFALTTQQVRETFQNGYTHVLKDVTRRMGWLRLKAGDRLRACVKCMGLKKGEKPEVLGIIEVVNVRRERLGCMVDDLHLDYGFLECKREGFEFHPRMKYPTAFVEFFCASHKDQFGKPCTMNTVVTRIEFRYICPVCNGDGHGHVVHQGVRHPVKCVRCDGKGSFAGKW